MRKIFQIVSYDFRRLMFNPITIFAMLGVLAFCMIFSATYKIPTQEAYSTNLSASTTQELYGQFTSSNQDDSRNNLYANNISMAEKIIEVQGQEESLAYDELKEINTQFSKIEAEIVKYENSKKSGMTSSSYIENNDISEIKNAAQKLKTFLDEYDASALFENNIYFTENTFKGLRTISTYFCDISGSSLTIVDILEDIVEHKTYFSDLNKMIGTEIKTLHIGAKLEDFQENYISKAKTKLAEIEASAKELNNSLTQAKDTESYDEMKNLLTNYKLTCESALGAVRFELYLFLNQSFSSMKNFYKYEKISKEETTVALTKATYFLNDKSVYYTQYQAPLNFNTASYQVSIYDRTYTIISIIGFATIIFGIFCAYKLFGLDRRNGKMDIILSQDVSYRQVFAAKFLGVVSCTSAVLFGFTILMLLWSLIFSPTLPGTILSVFNLSNPYTISPILFLLIKVLGIAGQVVFFSTITIFLMNVSRKFELFFGISLAIFAVATICNIFMNNILIYCLFPFIHADLTCFLGGGIINAGFLQTPLYVFGNFFISLAYFAVLVGLLYSFTNQMFKKN